MITSAGLVFICFVRSAAPEFEFMIFLPTPITDENTPPRSPFMYEVTAPRAPAPASLKRLGSLMLPEVSYCEGAGAEEGSTVRQQRSQDGST